MERKKRAPQKRPPKPVSLRQSPPTPPSIPDHQNLRQMPPTPPSIPDHQHLSLLDRDHQHPPVYQTTKTSLRQTPPTPPSIPDHQHLSLLDRDHQQLPVYQTTNTSQYTCCRNFLSSSRRTLLVLTYCSLMRSMSCCTALSFCSSAGPYVTQLPPLGMAYW